jgi:hypothetical protein
MFCKHKWELLSETVTKSRIEHLSDIGISEVTGLTKAAERKHIQVFACSICGKLKRFVEEI